MFRKTALTTLPLIALAATLATAAATPALAGAASVYTGGAPLEAEVRMRSLMGVPPAGYSLTCTGLAACSTQGQLDLETTATVPVAFDRRARKTRGVGELPFSSTEGSVSRAFSCEGEPDPFVSEIAVDGTRAGELEISELNTVPGTNEMAVALNHGGDSGDEFPEEITERSDGGCGTPVQDLTQRMGTWYYHFYFAHRDTQQQIGNDLEIDGLRWDGEAFSRTFDRFVTVGVGSNTYPLYESTRIEVEPDYCAGKQNRIVSATADGRSLGLDGMPFYPGQKISAPPKSKIRLGDGSVIELEDGGAFQIDECDTNETRVFLGEKVGSFWAHVKKAVAGSDKKFEVVTERAVAGVRGTIFEVAYDKAKQQTKVSVEESSVYLKGRNGAKGKVIVKAGQVGVQKGKKAPRIVKR